MLKSGTKNPRRRALAWAALLVTLILLPLAQANHIRVMVVSQSGANGNDVTLRVDFNYSGNCCGGVFNWDTGDGRTGSLSDGISGGTYQGDASGTGSLSNGDPFHWNRFRPDPSIMLVRIEITYSYASSGTYTVAWNDCCPPSHGAVAVVVSTGVPTTEKILAIQQAGNNNLQTAFANAAIPPCPSGPPLCYDLVLPTVFQTMTLTQLNQYKVIMVGTDSDVATIGALTVQKNNLLSWTVAGGGLVAYAQWQVSLGQWDWVPNLGGSPLTGVASAGSDVTMTPKGQAHPTHLNQVSNGPNTLSNWGNSRESYFTSWPGYFDLPVAGPLSVDNNGNAISLAGRANNGCVFVSGQPVDERAASNVLAAEQMFRSTINYALTCPV